MSIELDNELNELNSSLKGKEKQEHLAVPDGYFDQLPKELMQRISAAKTFYSVEKKENEEVSEAYFEQLDKKIIDKVASANDAKIISFKRVLMVAAGLALVLSVGYYFFSGNSTSKPSIASISDQDAVDYLCDEMAMDEMESLLAEMDPAQDVDSINAPELEYLMNEIDLNELENIE